MTGKKGGEEHGALAPEIIFRNKLKAFVGSTPPASKAREIGIEYRRFHRWLTDGIKRPNHHSLADVKKLADAMGLKDWRDLWPEEDSVELECRKIREKVDDLLQDEPSRQMLARAVEHIWENRKVRLANGEGPSE
jgi:hypothetical protein